jgi:hypothetical protein
VTADDRCPVLVINPLRRTLAHYEDELLETLTHSGALAVAIADTVPGDFVTGALDRVAVGARIVWERMRMAHSVSGQIVIVTWPLFGYLDPLTLRGLARHNVVYLIVHDPVAMRRSFCHSAWARRLFKAALHHRSIKILYHTAHAQQVGVSATGVKGIVVPHPVRLEPSRTNQSCVGRTSRPVVRVLGQYKHTRSLTALSAIADEAAGSCELEIHGLGWPDIHGWKVADRFVPEHEFTTLVQSSDCVVIAYDSFFQSGVAARCLEAGVPVVAPVNEHVAQLYGADWAGTAHDATDWYGALLRALSVGPISIQSRRISVARDIGSAWSGVLSTRSRTRNPRRKNILSL